MSNFNRVKTFVRLRPTSRFAHESIELPSDGKSVIIHCKKDKKRGYINNQILDWSFLTDKVLHNASQDEVYSTVGKDIVSQVLLGCNGTIMAYGQTGAGKTFTMTGSTEKFTHRGIIPRAITQLFKEINERRDYSTTVRISYLEIYNEFMFDLLGTLPNVNPVHPSLMTVTEDEIGQTHVKGLSVHIANTEEEALNLLFEGESNRIIASHSLNRHSSRSHCIFTIHIESRSRIESNATYTISKLNLVDLAGSERLGKTNSTGETEREAMYINKSLTFLEQVVVALAERQRDYIPYRQSKLTHVLKDSIGGSCCTAVIANIWGEVSQLEETTSTLRFLTRMLSIICEPAIDEKYDPIVVCKNYEKEIRTLRQELAKHDMLTNRGQITYEPLSEAQIEEIRSQVNRFLSSELEELELVNLRQIKEIFNQFKNVLNNMEATVEERLKEKFIMQERSATTTGRPDTGTKSSTTAGEESVQVGESDGQGFGVGVAAPNVKANVGTLLNTRKPKSRKGKDRNGSADGKPGSPAMGPSPTVQPDAQDGRPMSPASTVAAQQHTPGPRDTTPPPKSDAFEQFKQELGIELNRILHENKEILKEKRKASHSLSLSINFLKQELDVNKAKLEEKQMERQATDGVFDDGQEIIDEEEYEYLQKYKELKQKYRQEFEELGHVTSEISYCEKLVNQCRQRLVTEFETWYTESFLSGEGTRPSPSPGGLRGSGRAQAEPEDEQEKFDRLQLELLMEHPDSVPYYNARMQTERRAHYTSAGQNKRKPGGIIPSIRNKPPNTLTVQ